MNDDGASPKYEALRSNLERYIADGLAPHEALPSERELTQRFSVSRMTVREAISRLVADGLVYRVPGAGTFVADPATISKSLTLTSFSEDIKARHMVPGSREILREIIPADPLVANDLCVAVGHPVVHLERLRLADGMPMCLENVWLSHDLVGELNDSVDSLYDVLEERGYGPEYAHQTIRASAVEGEAARLLDVADGSPTIVVSRTTYSRDDEPIERGVSAYRADRYDFQLTVYRK